MGEEILIWGCSTSFSCAPTSHRTILDKRLSHAVKGEGDDNVLGDVNISSFLGVRWSEPGMRI